VVDNEFVKPGKGQAFNRLRYRNLKNGRVIERTYKSGDSIPAADVVEIDAQFLYGDGSEWNFMASETYEQYAVHGNEVADAKLWLKEQFRKFWFGKRSANVFRLAEDALAKCLSAIIFGAELSPLMVLKKFLLKKVGWILSDQGPR